MFLVLVCIMSKTDPVVRFARWGYAVRRIVLIGASTLKEVPAEFLSRLKAGQLRDSAALAELEKPYLTGKSTSAQENQPAPLAERHPWTTVSRKSYQRQRHRPTSVNQGTQDSALGQNGIP